MRFDFFANKIDFKEPTYDFLQEPVFTPILP